MIQRFEARRGVRVRYGTYESNEEMLAKAITGNSGWDVVFPTHSRLAPMARNGLLAAARPPPPALPAQSRRAFPKPRLGPAAQWGVPYMWNATGIAYNKTQVPEPQGWSALWAARLKGRLTMLDDPEDVIGACLQKLRLPSLRPTPRSFRPPKRKPCARSNSCAPT